jgi:hypothetical protein
VNTTYSADLKADLSFDDENKVRHIRPTHSGVLAVFIRALTPIAARTI